MLKKIPKKVVLANELNIISTYETQSEKCLSLPSEKLNRTLELVPPVSPTNSQMVSGSPETFLGRLASVSRILKVFLTFLILYYFANSKPAPTTVNIFNCKHEQDFHQRRIDCAE